ncbi:MAG: hypothetical protein ACRENB_08295, partial [Gemmatimonadales bacterium]
LTLPFGATLKAAPLPDGRWVVVAPDFDTVLLADVAGRTTAPLAGPAARGALLHPITVFTVADTIYIGDWGRRRTTVWAADGSLLDSIPAPDALRGVLPEARDAAGQLYYEVSPAPGRDGSGNRDSAAIVRVPLGLARFDTVARLTPLELKEVTRESVTRFEQQIFSGTDQWGVRSDGTVWVARVFRNRVMLYPPRGDPLRGPELPDPVYEVTQADRDWHLSNYPPDLRPNEIDLPWALIHPPFVAAFQSGDETIWLEKSKVVTDSLRRIHLLDREGRLQRILQLVGHGRLAAVRPGVVLVAEPTGAGVRLMEVRVPARASSPRP